MLLYSHWRAIIKMSNNKKCCKGCGEILYTLMVEFKMVEPHWKTVWLFLRWLSLKLWHPTQILLPGKSHGRRSLVGCSPGGREESEMTERLHFDFSLSCIGEDNGNPLQYSCLENPRDGGAWWAAVCGITQSRTWLKRFSSSSSNVMT